jgi:hypothetical protein
MNLPAGRQVLNPERSRRMNIECRSGFTSTFVFYKALSVVSGVERSKGRPLGILSMLSAVEGSKDAQYRYTDSLFHIFQRPVNKRNHGLQGLKGH